METELTDGRHDQCAVDPDSRSLCCPSIYDSEMTDAVVVAKADAASQWVRTVNASPAVGPHWAYALVSETAIRSAAGWRQLLAAARITR